jgi:hypothetical protein
MGHPVVHHIHKLATPLWSEKFRRVDWRDTLNRPDEIGGQEHQPGKNIVSELVEAVRCAKSLGKRVSCLPPLWSPIGVVVVLNFKLLFSEEELSPAPKS